MSRVEEWIFKTAAAWEGNTSDSNEIKSEYNVQYDDEDLQSQVSLLMELMVYPIKSLRKEALNLAVKRVLGTNLTPEKLKVIYDDVDKNLTVEDTTLKVDTKSLADRIKNKKDIQYEI